MPAGGLPSLRGGDRFFVEVPGAEEFYGLGPFEVEDDWMETHLAQASTFELFPYTTPDQAKVQPRSSHVGGIRVALSFGTPAGA